MSSTPLIFRLLNPVMKGMLNSPLHSMLSDRIMVLTFKGRSSGRTYSTPVSYCQENGTVLVFTHARWWQNLVGGARVWMRIRGRERTGTAIPIPEDREKKIAGLGRLLTAVPSDARFYNVSLDQEGRPNAADLEQAVESATMIEVSLDQAA